MKQVCYLFAGIMLGRMGNSGVPLVSFCQCLNESVMKIVAVAVWYVMYSHVSTNHQSHICAIWTSAEGVLVPNASNTGGIQQSITLTPGY